MENQTTVNLVFVSTLLFGCSDRDQPAVAETDGAESSSSGDTPLADDTIDPADSGSTGEEPVAECGNGVVEGDEACDELDAIDGDGCNVDCQISGSIAWTWEPDEGDIKEIAAAPDGTLFVAIVDSGETSASFVHLSATGEVIDEQTVIAPRSPVPGGSVALDIIDVVVVEGDVVYASESAIYDADDGYAAVIGTIERLGPQGWSLVEDERFLFDLAVTSAFDVVGSDDADVFKYSASGEELWRTAGGGVRGVAAGADGGLVIGTGSAVIAYGPDGAESWSVAKKEPRGSGSFRALTQTADGVLAMQSVILDPMTLEETGRIWHIDSQGEVVTTWDTPFTLSFAADPAGNLLITADVGGDVEGLAKYTPQFEPLWVTPLMDTDGSVGDIEAADGGLVFVVVGERTVVALRP